jgi:hypothetical protein
MMKCVFLFQHAWTCLSFLELVSSQNDVHVKTNMIPKIC